MRIPLSALRKQLLRENKLVQTFSAGEICLKSNCYGINWDKVSLFRLVGACMPFHRKVQPRLTPNDSSSSVVYLRTDHFEDLWMDSSAERIQTGNYRNRRVVKAVISL